MEFSYKKIGLLGGSFDPPHFGHLHAAEAVFVALSPDVIVFMPSCAPPHKINSAADNLRLEMVKLATAENPHFAVSDLEIRNKFSYTVETVRYIKSVSDAEIFFIIGADQLARIKTWKASAELLELCAFVCVTRPGYEIKNLNEITPLFKKGLHVLETPSVDISSSDIRRNVYRAKPVRYLIPDSVWRFTEENRLYKSNASKYTHLLYEEIDEVLKNNLSKKRYLHSKSVAHEAQSLALTFGEDPEKAYLAGLLHDCAKYLDEDGAKKAFKKYKIKIDDSLKRFPEIYHCFLGAEMARTDFGVTDKDILNAVRYHTTGRKGMSLLEKIVYVSDVTEVSRKSYPGLDKVRETAKYDINAASHKALLYKIGYAERSGKKAHPLSIEFLESQKPGEI